MSRWPARVVWTAVSFLVAIGVIAGLARGFSVLGSLHARGTRLDAFDSRYAAHPALTSLHVVPGLVFMVLAPLQFVASIRSRHLAVHRWTGRLLLGAGTAFGVSGLVLGLVMPFGGGMEASATAVFASLFLIALAVGFVNVRRGRVERHREWMIRMFSLGLGVSTIRLVVGLFLAFGHRGTPRVFGLAFWIGWAVSLAGAEAWIRHTRPRAAQARAA
jgi:uncharacterized membrane protein